MKTHLFTLHSYSPIHTVTLGKQSDSDRRHPIGVIRFTQETVTCAYVL